MYFGIHRKYNVWSCFSPSHITEIFLWWVTQSYIVVNGNAHNTPDGQKTTSIGQEDSDLTYYLYMEYSYVYQIQPGNKQWEYAIVVIGVLLFISLCIYHIPLWATGIVDYKGQTYCMTMVPFYKIQHILTYIDTALTFVVPLSAILICMCLLICKAVTAHHRTSTNRERFNFNVFTIFDGCRRVPENVSITSLSLVTWIGVWRIKNITETAKRSLVTFR
jgi:hypothetical protein